MTRADFLAAIIANPSDGNTRLVFADWLSDHGEEERAELIRLQCKLASLSPTTIEGHIVSYPLPFVALVRRDALYGVSDPIILRHQQRDDSWWTSSIVRIFKVDEWDDSRVKVTFEIDAEHPKLLAREKSLISSHGPRWLLDEILKPSGLWQADNPHLLYPVHEGDWRRGFVEALAMPWETWQAKGEQLTLATPLREVVLTDIVRIDAAMQPLLVSPLGRLSVLKLKGHPSTVPILEGILKERFPSLSVSTI